MVGTSSSSSSCASFSSFDDVSAKPSATVKLLCSYGGKILPRYPDGKLRYVGGDTRVLSVDRSLPFSELQGKLREMCGWEAVSLRCQLPTEDMDALVSVTCDEDLHNVVEEYHLAVGDRLHPVKIRAVLFPAATSPAKSPKSISPPSTPPIAAVAAKGRGSRPSLHSHAARPQPPANLHCIHQIGPSARLPGHNMNPGGDPQVHYGRRHRHHHRHPHHHNYAAAGHVDPRTQHFPVRHGDHRQ